MNIYKKEELLTKNNAIAIWKNRALISEDLHTHEFIELSYIVSGTSKQYIDGVEYSAKSGDLLFVNLGQTHAFTIPENSTMIYYNISIDQELLSKNILHNISYFETMLLSAIDDVIKINLPTPFISFKGDDKLKLENILSEMEHEFQNAPVNSMSAIIGYLMVVFSYIFRMFDTITDDAADIAQDIQDYIDAHYSEKLSLKTIAQQSFYSPKYISHIFKSSYGISITEYIRKKRIDRAKQLLKETNFRIDVIGQQIGYSNPVHFYNYFKSQCGLTPNDYRQKYNSEHK